MPVLVKPVERKALNTKIDRNRTYHILSTNLSRILFEKMNTYILCFIDIHRRLPQGLMTTNDNLSGVNK